MTHIAKPLFGTVLAAGMLAGCTTSQHVDTKTSFAGDQSEDYTGDEQPKAPANLAELPCWQANMLGELDQAFTMTLFYGFARGLASRSVVSNDNILAASNATIKQCLSQPDAKVLQVMRESISYHDADLGG